MQCARVLLIRLFNKPRVAESGVREVSDSGDSSTDTKVGNLPRVVMPVVLLIALMDCRQRPSAICIPSAVTMAVACYTLFSSRWSTFISWLG
jgi:hypothetical protein